MVVEFYCAMGELSADALSYTLSVRGVSINFSPSIIANFLNIPRVADAYHAVATRGSAAAPYDSDSPAASSTLAPNVDSDTSSDGSEDENLPDDGLTDGQMRQLVRDLLAPPYDGSKCRPLSGGRHRCGPLTTSHSTRARVSNSKLKLETYKRYCLTDMDEEDKAKIIRTKLRGIESWISTIGLSYQLKHIIKSYVTPLILEDQKKDIDTENPFPHLPTPLGRLIKQHLCLPLLRTVPIFENESEELLYEITCFSSYDSTLEFSRKRASKWDVAFLVVCVVAVAVDPLFFYLPVINESTKCITIDKTLEIIAICVRSFLDLVALGDLVARSIASSVDDCYSRSDYVINILSILPVPQVLVPIIFSEMIKGLRFRHGRKFLNAVVLLQYVPRIFRIYRLWKIVNQTIILPKSIPPTATTRVNVVNAESNKYHVIPPKGFIVMKAGFNLFLYLVASHVLGAFWYFYSIERETTCWHVACERHQTDIGCSETSFNCHAGFGNHTILNDYCSLEKNTNTTLSFDFGIFQEARQSGILASMDFPQKAMFCFWWGLRNLSSFGQNLETSPYYWENCFTVLISIFGLILFLYFIGNLQVYMQWEVSNELEEIYKRSKFKQHNKIMRTKLRSIECWISTIGLPDQLKQMIMTYVTPILEDQNKHIDTENPFPHLPTALGRLIKLHLCLPLLRRVPILKNESEELLFEITCKFLKHVHYNQSSYIVREGEPLDALIFVVKGIAWTYTSNHGNKTECVETGDHFGRRLVKWVLESPTLSDLPLSTRTLKCHTKVEGFYLMATDLKDMLSQCWWKFSKFRHIVESDSEQLKHFAASSIQAAWRRHTIHPHKVRT
ncbi:cyclic nucleotide-gated ion channel 1-like [Juglans microcarpa x Juglans regia]|uniref:cyclic nucleotide-gated ion channel 1-like n=1 Tax=Juglans microcarpa x Juglans regia TaxID=2249226 RepID=UPI001B7EFF92|nr:cyclic nucleotide-gated ion channel 1-like [Juglans microcarpa x Juglans regia]